MKKEKAPRNKTIDTSLSEGRQYLERCLRIDSAVTDVRSVLDRTVIGDTFEVCAFLPGESVDLVVADPPYNRTKLFNASRFSRKSAEEYEAYTRRWLALVLPLLKPTGSLYVCCDWESSLIVGSVLGEHLHVRNRITWQREKGRGASANWKNGLEDIWFATRGDDYTFNLDAVRMRRRVIAPYRVNRQPKDWLETREGNFRDSCPSNFWDDITIPFWSMPENTAHPAQKPEKLIAKMMLAGSNPGDVVFDPFLGSGTTSVVARKLGRHYVGVEIEEQYCLWAEQRLEAAETDREIQGYADGVFWERNTLAGRRARSAPEATGGKGQG